MLHNQHIPSKITIHSWQKPILRSHRCLLRSNAIPLQIYSNISITECEIIDKWHRLLFQTAKPTHPIYLFYQRLKITSVSDTARWYSEVPLSRNRRSREHQRIYTTAHANKHSSVRKHSALSKPFCLNMGKRKYGVYFYLPFPSFLSKRGR